MICLRAGCTEYFIIIYWGEVKAASREALRSAIAKYLLLFDGITYIFPKFLQCKLAYRALGCRKMFLCLHCWSILPLILMVSSWHLTFSTGSTITTRRTTLNVSTEPSSVGWYVCRQCKRGYVLLFTLK